MLLLDGNRPGSESRCRPPIGINTIESGALVADLHLWNEHIPPMPKGGPDLVWARQVSTQVRRSLDELARNLATLQNSWKRKPVGRAYLGRVAWKGRTYVQRRPTSDESDVLR